MNELDTSAFESLFKEAFEKCFGYPLKESLSETESKLFYNKIFDQTGLVVGWKSLKNYSSFIVEGPVVKPENPSIATLDTLSRYVVAAPYSSETERKEKESHYPYWFGYKEKFHRSSIKEPVAVRSGTRRQVILASGFFLVIILIIIVRNHYRPGSVPFVENFHDLSPSSLNQHGWFLQSPDTVFWNRRDEKKDRLTLFTIRGDNWPNGQEKIGVRNLLLRKITKDCFEAEVHFADFLPDQNWQQAGLLLLEDTNFTGKGIRLSVAYNDFFGGYNKPKEIIIQAITSFGKNYGEPEEIAHQPVAFTDSIRLHPELAKNLANSSLKIEKEGKKFRFLFAGGSVSNPAFKEVVTHEFDMQPRYIGLFAMKGFVDSAAIMPVHFTFFRLKENDCE
jgi:hypothetical protein